jgi:hypothetical protein
MAHGCVWDIRELDLARRSCRAVYLTELVLIRFIQSPRAMIELTTLTGEALERCERVQKKPSPDSKLMMRTFPCHLGKNRPGGSLKLKWLAPFWALENFSVITGSMGASGLDGRFRAERETH